MDSLQAAGSDAADRPEPVFAALVAIDWADQKHVWSMRTAAGLMERGTLEHTPEAVELWAVELNRRFGGAPVALALEQRRGALVVLLSKYAGQLHLYPVHPATLAQYRKAWHPSGAKSDPLDADLLLEILTAHRHRLRPIAPESSTMRLLSGLTENRRKLVDDRTALTNRLEQALKICYPQIPVWFDNLATELVGDLLAKWPTLEKLQKAQPGSVSRFLRTHHWHDDEKIEGLITKIRAAVPATRDEAVLGTMQPMITAALQQIAILRQIVKDMEKQIVELAQSQPDWTIFNSLPGAGPALAPRLMAAMGSCRERFASAAELQSFIGIAPVQEASGNSVWIHFRLACPRFLRQTFHEWAAFTIPRSPWAREFYDAAIAKGKKHHVAVRALAFKWMRILFRCWKDRTPYREEIYLASRTSRLLPKPISGLCKNL
jgi:transposase